MLLSNPFLKVKFDGRRTKMGAYTSTSVFEIQNTLPILINPIKTEYSRTGNHWTDYYQLELGKTYLIVVTDISNSGKHYCYYYTAKATQDTLKTTNTEVHLTVDVLSVMCECLLKKIFSRRD